VSVLLRTSVVPATLVIRLRQLSLVPSIRNCQMGQSDRTNRRLTFCVSQLCNFGGSHASTLAKAREYFAIDS